MIISPLRPFQFEVSPCVSHVKTDLLCFLLLPQLSHVS